MIPLPSSSDIACSILASLAVKRVLVGAYSKAGRWQRNAPLVPRVRRSAMLSCHRTLHMAHFMPAQHPCRRWLALPKRDSVASRDGASLTWRDSQGQTADH